MVERGQSATRQLRVEYGITWIGLTLSWYFRNLVERATRGISEKVYLFVLILISAEHALQWGDTFTKPITIHQFLHYMPSF